MEPDLSLVLVLGLLRSAPLDLPRDLRHSGLQLQKWLPNIISAKPRRERGKTKSQRRPRNSEKAGLEMVLRLQAKTAGCCCVFAIAMLVSIDASCS